MVNGNPSLFYITPGTNVQFYIDNKGGCETSFSYGSISIPIDSIDTYASYQDIPNAELQYYFHLLLRNVTRLYSENSGKDLDICAIQYDLLNQLWPRWISKGYVSEKTPRPVVMRIYRSLSKS